LTSIVRPDRDRSEDGVLAVTHDQTFANPALKAKTPFVKPPIFIDYGVRLHVGGSTFINRNCMIMDTPVADVVIGEGCNIGANCVIVGVTRKFPTLPTIPASHKARSGAVPVQPTRASGQAAGGLLPVPPRLWGKDG
jgi:acetyltransferase-like isoleucine patch superfamily enzyme